jgi:hypothetical protein
MEEQVMDSAEFIEKNGDEIFITDPTWEDVNQNSNRQTGSETFLDAETIPVEAQQKIGRNIAITVERKMRVLLATGVNIQKQKGVTYNAIHTVP